MTRSRRRKPKPLTKAQRALADWLALQMADPVAATQAYQVVSKHAGLIRWMVDAEISHVMPAPQRRHLGDPRDANRITGRSGSGDPDDHMIAIIDARLFGHGHDPEHLDPVRQRMNAKLGDLAGWYGQRELVDVAEWEPLATRLGDLVGDQVAANALALCCIRHARLAYSPDEKAQTKRKNARDRWYRLASWYVRVLDEQPSKGKGHAAVESVDVTGNEQGTWRQRREDERRSG